MKKSLIKLLIEPIVKLNEALSRCELDTPPLYGQGQYHIDIFLWGGGGVVGSGVHNIHINHWFLTYSGVPLGSNNVCSLLPYSSAEIFDFTDEFAAAVWCN